MEISDNILVKVRNEDIKDGTFIIPSYITTIGEWAFCRCSNLTNINIPDSVTIIKDNVFECCKNLSTISISNNISVIGREVFIECTNLTNINIPDSVTKIGDYAFYDCERLTNITISNNLKEIGENAFCRCKNLTNINIPDSVTKIGNCAFSRCENLNLNIKTSLFSSLDEFIKYYDYNRPFYTFDVNSLVIYDKEIDLSKIKTQLKKLRKEELLDKIISELLKNNIKDKKCFKLSEHIGFINKVTKNLELHDGKAKYYYDLGHPGINDEDYYYDYRPDFNNYIKDYINKHKEETINVDEILKEMQNYEINYNELKKYPYIISTLRLNIETSYSKNEGTIKLKKVLSKLTKIELNNPSDFVKLILKIFFDSDEGAVINKASMESLINYSKRQIEVLEEQNKTYEALKEIIKIYFQKEKKCKANLNKSDDTYKNLELSEEEIYLNYEQITNEIDYNFSCIMRLREITSVIIPILRMNVSLKNIVLKRKEEVKILSDILNELNSIIETKERQSIEINSLEMLYEQKTAKKNIM